MVLLEHHNTTVRGVVGTCPRVGGAPQSDCQTSQRMFRVTYHNVVIIATLLGKISIIAHTMQSYYTECS